LHVGAGTFKPVKSEEIEGHEMHTEYIQIGWNRKFSEHFEDIGESYFGVIPCEVYPMAGTFAFSSRCCQSNRKAFDYWCIATVK